MEKLPLNGSDWTLVGWMRHQWNYEKTMETNGMSVPVVAAIPATVPGSVQTDLLRSGKIDDWNFGVNFRKIEWVEHREWVYTKHFRIEEPADRYVLHFEGLDYHGFVFLNNRKALTFAGMHIPYRVDITDLIAIGEENELRVVFLQPPEVDGQIGYTSKVEIFKSRFNYGWDWSPRLVNIGIFRDVYIEAVKKAEVISADFTAELSENGGVVLCRAAFEGDASVTAELSLLDGEKVIASVTKETAVSGKTEIALQTDPAAVEAWFPNGFGRQPLYTARLRVIFDGETVGQRSAGIGFRTLSYAVPQGAPRGCLPYTPVINGKKIPIRGINWVPLSPFYGAVTEEQYRYYLNRFRQMNCNLIRVWGGALRESEVFYRLCDEMGFLVWQEFPQSSSGIDNAPNEDDGYIRELGRIAVTYIRELRSHVSLTYWCGGNELYWKMAGKLVPADCTSGNLAMLESTVRTHCPEILFLPTSPSRVAGGNPQTGEFINGDAHGEWVYCGLDAHYSMIEKSKSVLFSEIGTAACPRKETLARYCDGAVWPPDFSNEYWVSRGAWWIMYDEMRGYFGEFEDFPDPLLAYTAAFRYLQAESLRYSADAVRRGGEQKAGVIFWMGNESFPNSANNSLIEYDGMPKPAYYEVQKSFAQLTVCLSYATVSPAEGERFSFQLFVLSDGENDLPDLKLQLFDRDGAVLWEKNYSERVSGIKKLDTVTFIMPPAVCTVRVSSNVCGLLREWSFFARTKAPMRPLLAGKAALCAEKRPDGVITVENVGKVIAYYTEVMAFDRQERPLTVTPNFFCLLPGERMECTAESEPFCFSALPMNGQ